MAVRLFDSYNLRSRILDGTAPQDEYLFGLSEMDSQRMAELLRRRHSVIGWGLVMIGIYLLYQMLLNQLWWMMGDWFLGDWLYSLLRYDVPPAGDDHSGYFTGAVVYPGTQGSEGRYSGLCPSGTERRAGRT